MLFYVRLKPTQQKEEGRERGEGKGKEQERAGRPERKGVGESREANGGRGGH